MTRFSTAVLLCATLTVIASGVLVAEPVRQIGIYVEPFYRSARTPGETPQVAVGRRYDELLASSRREDILAVRDRVIADSKVVTPMVMMVLAMRLYDVGERDEAVFWFYAAKDRTMILTEVATPNAAQLGQAVEAIRAFSTLGGPVINGYAFCDLKNQQAIRARALDWVAANPYQVMFIDVLPARGSDRAALAEAALKQARDNAGKERAHFDDERNRAAFYATRKQNDTDSKFCWR
jgi:hypothetical protein